mgnify:CR=1 FL=1
MGGLTHQSRGIKRAREPAGRLLQCAERGTEVEVQRLSTNHEGRHGFHAGALRLGHALLGGAEMHDLERDLVLVEVARDRRFRVETNRAAGMVKSGRGLFHDFSSVFGSLDSRDRGVAGYEDSPCPLRTVEGTFRSARTFLCLLDAHAVRLIIATMPAKHLSLTERNNYRRLEDVVGCKWSAALVGALQRGVSRPGQLERYIPGISTKILNERLRKLVAYGLATRMDRSKAILHVEYQLTPTGTKLAGVIDQLHALQAEHSDIRAGGPAATAPRSRV